MSVRNDSSAFNFRRPEITQATQTNKHGGFLTQFSGRWAWTAAASLNAMVRILACMLCGLVGNLLEKTGRSVGGLTATVAEWVGSVALTPSGIKPILAHALTGTVVRRASKKVCEFSHGLWLTLRNTIRIIQVNDSSLSLRIVWFVLGKLARYLLSRTLCSGIALEILAFVLGELTGHVVEKMKGHVSCLKSKLIEWTESFVDKMNETKLVLTYVLHEVAVQMSDRVNRFATDLASGLSNSVKNLVNSTMLSILAFVSGELARYLWNGTNEHAVSLTSSLGQLTECLADKACAAILVYVLHAVAVRLSERVNEFTLGPISWLNVFIQILVQYTTNATRRVLTFVLVKVTEMLVNAVNALVRVLDMALGEIFDSLHDRFGVDLITVMENIIRDAGFESNRAERVFTPTTATAGGNHGEPSPTEQPSLKDNVILQNSVLKSNRLTFAQQELSSKLIKKVTVSECKKKSETSVMTTPDMPLSNIIATRPPAKRVPQGKFTWSKKLKHKHNPNISLTYPPLPPNPEQFFYGYHNYRALRRPPMEYRDYGAFRRPPMWQQTQMFPRSFLPNSGIRLSYPVHGFHPIPSVFNAQHMLGDENGHSMMF